jgi:hypothetical protein
MNVFNEEHMSKGRAVRKVCIQCASKNIEMKGTWPRTDIYEVDKPKKRCTPQYII